MKKIMAAAITAVATLTATFAAASPASAYDKYGAANYADTYALSSNSSYPSFSDDCTNFVSQALNGGGYSFVGYPNSTTDDHNWWIAPNYWWWDYTHSWSVAADLHTFLQLDYPGGWSEGTAPGSSTSYWDPSAMTSGDVLFYDWGGGDGISHAARQVGYGTDPNSGWTGNYVDEHTSNRKHAFWSLKPYNSKWATTTIYFTHIGPNNN